MGKQRLELTWIGKNTRPKLEPRILIETPENSFGSSDAENMLIHGDNLLALKALEQDYSGKIKCIYIDPPYNTGNAFEHYDDGLEHSLWLSLLRDRLFILRHLLSDDGSIWINIDDNEGHYLKLLCDEVFGRANYKTTITWQKKYSVSNNYKGIASITDFILVYSKSDLFLNNLLPRSKESQTRYKNPDNDLRGPWKSVDYLNQASPEKRPNLCYDIINPNTGVVIKNKNKAWKYSKEVHEQHLADKRLWWGVKGTNTTPALKLFLSEVRDGMTPHNWWPYDEVGHTDEAKKENNKLFGAQNSFDTPKPERLLKRIIEIATNPSDIVLDSFLGSGTTAAVAHKMGRKWIGVELGEHCYTHCKKRMDKVVSGEDQGGVSIAENWKGGGGYKFYELAPSLLNKDAYGNWIINKDYNADMMAAAMAKQEGFNYNPAQDIYWKQGQSTEQDYIFTTTEFLTQEHLEHIHSQMKDGESLLICCKAFNANDSQYSNITIKKIPQMLMGKCEFGKNDYSLNIINMPTEEDEEEEFPDSVSENKQRYVAGQAELFNMEADNE